MKTLQVRIKDKHSKLLEAMSRDANLAWNFVNELSYKHLQRTGKFFSAYEMQKYLTGATKEGICISANSLNEIAAQYEIRRRKERKAKLRWRTSFGAKKSLGWIPIRGTDIRYQNGQLRYYGHFFSIWDSYGLANFTIKTSNFSQDTRGRWYANLCVEAIQEKSLGTKSVGIDLGIKDFAVLSTGEKIEAQHIYRGAEKALAVAQRANKPLRVKSVHAKIKNRRKDFLQKLSTTLVKEHGAIFVGNVNAAGLAKTNMAKSVLDAGWSSFRAMLKYKCDYAGVLFEEVNEAYSTVTCSVCGSHSGPGGLKGLRIREWACGDCGEVHDRDTNAAMNILARGHASLAEGVPARTGKMPTHQQGRMEFRALAAQTEGE